MYAFRGCPESGRDCIIKDLVITYYCGTMIGPIIAAYRDSEKGMER